MRVQKFSTAATESARSRQVREIALAARPEQQYGAPQRRLDTEPGSGAGG